MNNFDSSAKQSWRESLLIYKQPRVVGMLFLGFSAGLPFPLIFTTLSTWLARVGISKTTIGFFAWVGLTYSIKVFWAPIVDRVPLPVLGKLLGQRRSWMLLAQVGIAAGLLGIAFTDPTQDIARFAWFSLLVAFASATQDISIDAYRIEAVEPESQGAMAGTYQTGYRLAATLIGGAVALSLADITSWQNVYILMTSCIAIGMMTVLIIQEPKRSINAATAMNETRVIDFLENAGHLPGLLRIPFAWFIGAVICPFTEFFQRNGRWAFTLLLFIGLYRVSDIVMANMAYPLYVDLGFTNTEIAGIAKIFGILMTIAGAIFGGTLVLRFGALRTLLVGAILVAATTLFFAQLAVMGKSLGGLTLVICADNFSGGLATSAFIAFLSRLTNTAYTATQYALFSSLMTLPAKFFSGFSGIIVDAHGYPIFFIYSACLGIPAIMLVIYLLYNQQHIPEPTTDDS